MAITVSWLLSSVGALLTMKTCARRRTMGWQWAVSVGVTTAAHCAVAMHVLMRMSELWRAERVSASARLLADNIALYITMIGTVMAVLWLCSQRHRHRQRRRDDIMSSSIVAPITMLFGCGGCLCMVLMQCPGRCWRVMSGEIVLIVMWQLVKIMMLTKSTMTAGRDMHCHVSSLLTWGLVCSMLSQHMFFATDHRFSFGALQVYELPMYHMT